ncbi:acyl-CoA thioesterase [Tepidamorphus gemmatus]|jgi:acyl-CoA thioesterase|uniref:Acyl-CoA thioesterase n=1 Tax=Tepidamorphus gemmatus TaxID=747076 RepID=A0A4V2UYU1_9HYPH|nr:hotdog fold thioesterase [Tepidamorphus gemmatus]TCT08728.1 acyl-CoA thioesterase [Tepidamorphus gemmatus]
MATTGGGEDEAAKARRRVEDTVYGDPMMRSLGIVVEEAEPGRVVLSMTPTPQTANWYGIVHGGAIFTLADSAFGCASVSRGEETVANHCHVSFLSPGSVGEQLFATAEERYREGRNGIYDVTVRTAGGRIVAELRGWSRGLPPDRAPRIVGNAETV